MKDKDKIETIKYMCEKILDDESIIYHKVFARMVLKSILEVCNG